MASCLELGADTSDFQAAAVDALGALGVSGAAAAVLAAQSPALLESLVQVAFAGTPDQVRLPAIHTLATLLGMERRLQEAAPGGPLMGRDAEVVYRGAMYRVCARLRQSPAEALLAMLQRSSGEIRVGGYRLLSALSRRPWGLSEACSLGGLMDRVLDPASETGRQASEFRYAAVLAMAATQRDLEEAAYAGIFDGVSQIPDACSRPLRFLRLTTSHGFLCSNTNMRLQFKRRRAPEVWRRRLARGWKRPRGGARTSGADQGRRTAPRSPPWPPNTVRI